MVDLSDNQGFVPVTRVEVSDIYIGGNETNQPNLSLAQLTSRDKFLKDAIDALSGNTENVPAFGGNNREGDLTISADTTLDRGLYSVNNFVVEAGVTVTVVGGVTIQCTGDATINGTMICPPVVPGGGEVFLGYTASAGNFVIYPPITGQGQGAGGSFSPGAPYPFPFLLGSGGAGGRVQVEGVDTGGTPAIGGLGGGYIIIEAAGTINVSVNGVIDCRGGSGIAPVGNFFRASGSGGGSGGCIWLKSSTSIALDSGASIRVPGGAGSNALTVANGATLGSRGGGGGGGGYIVLNSENITNNAGINVGGGSAGTDSVDPVLGGTAGAGFGGAGGASHSNGSIGVLLLLNFKPI